MQGHGRDLVAFVPSVLVTGLPVIAAPLLGQPLYRVFLYYAIELVVFVSIICCLPFFVSTDEGTAGKRSDWTTRNTIAVVGAVGAPPLLLLGVVTGPSIAVFLAAVVGLLAMPHPLNSPTEWTLATRLRFACGAFPAVLLFVFLVSVGLWQIGAVVSEALTGTGPPSGTVNWIVYLDEIQPLILAGAVVIIASGTLQTVYRELITSGKYQHTTAQKLFAEYLIIGIAVPMVLWFVAIVTLVLVLSVSVLVTAVGAGWMEWIGTVAISGWFIWLFGVYIGLQSYIDWQRLQAQRAWERGHYGVSLVPPTYEFTVPILGRVELGHQHLHTDSED